MAEDPQLTLAKANYERIEAEFGPDSWAAAEAYIPLRPEVRCPVIIGGKSMFKTAGDLRDLLQLPSVPPLTQTIETTLFPYHSEEEEQAQNKETLDIADVSLGQYLDLQNLTEGDMDIVWFRGQRRYAWLATSRKTEDSVVPSKD
jgi:hypothetical protein